MPSRVVYSVLATTFSNKVYPDEAPPNVALPYCVYTLDFSEFDYHLGGRGNTRRDDYSIEINAASFSSLQTLIVSAVADLDAARDAAIATVMVDATILNDVSSTPEPSKYRDDQPIYTATIDATIAYTE